MYEGPTRLKILYCTTAAALLTALPQIQSSALETAGVEAHMVESQCKIGS